MNTFFVIALAVYLAVFIAIGLLDAKRIRTFADYCVAGKNQTLFSVVMTLLATILGASTTIGVTDTVYRIGFPGIWWLAFGAVGLLLQSLFLSERVRGIDADTLPDLAGKTVGRSAELLIALVIVVSWVGVVAGQLVAMNSLISFALGKSSPWLFAAVSFIVIVYTAIGGQMSVIKTDAVQLLVVLGAVAACVLYLYGIRGGNTADVLGNIELVNESYPPSNLLTQFFVIGGVYFLGPDILSRNFISRSGKTAKGAACISAFALLFFSLLITLVGMWLRYNVSAEQKGAGAALLYAVSLLPKWLAVLLLFGLLSAILSSTDTCIINASSILAKDILRREQVAVVRGAVLLVGLLSLALALLGRDDIMGLLTSAYSVYTPGVLFPLAVAIFAHGKGGVRPGLWLSAVAAGGLCGLASSYGRTGLLSLGLSASVVGSLTLVGMALSLLLSLLSVRRSGGSGGAASVGSVRRGLNSKKEVR